jgi:hypothetical protein
MQKYFQASAIVSGVIVAIIVAVVLDYTQKGICSPATCTGGAGLHRQVLCTIHPNLNAHPASPAHNYGSGAPVSNYRPYKFAGTMRVKAS